mmetsp:Transcript_9342/g.13896  ORF Transcript_9342/g.13896 Transcript_9342/m.13896 type:complete len:526 (-) Transcript_9342:8-1585(-)
MDPFESVNQTANGERTRSTPLQEVGQNEEHTAASNTYQWEPSGTWWRDFLFFAGPGWMASVAFVDPGNYQADIQAGALSQYSLVFILWWTCVLSIYVQILCVRLGYYSGMSLSEAQAKYLSSSDRMRYLNWFLAEFSTVVTDLPEVIGIGIACNIFFNWPYWVGVVLSLLSTMVFLMTLNYSTKVLDIIIGIFIAIMAIALMVEMSFVGVDSTKFVQGWTYGILDLKKEDIFSVTGVVGAVVMPHNLYLHSGECKSRSAQVPEQHAIKAVYWSSLEPVLPIMISFFINIAVVSIAAERVYGSDGAENVGLTDFCTYFEALVAGCSLWGITLLASGQSSAITTTHTGQYVMDGFLNLQLPIKTRAILTRLVAITPCVIVSILLPNHLNQIINVVNALLSFLLPFAFTPLVVLNCDEVVMGSFASKGCEKYLLHIFAFAVWFVNAIGLSFKGGGFFGDWRYSISNSGEGGGAKLFFLVILEISLQIFYVWWNVTCIRTSTSKEYHHPSNEFELTQTDQGERQEHEVI